MPAYAGMTPFLLRPAQRLLKVMPAFPGGSALRRHDDAEGGRCVPKGSPSPLHQRQRRLVAHRAFLEARLDESDLACYRQEITAARQGGRGLSSYPHPWLMPDFWQFPTGSMGLEPISSIYQARFMRYLSHRGLLDTSARKVWGVFGDGEMDEPESMSALTLAAREQLHNLVWVVNCNLQRLDGPVRGNGRIIDELQALFAGAGWRVIKLVWGVEADVIRGLYLLQGGAGADRAGRAHGAARAGCDRCVRLRAGHRALRHCGRGAGAADLLSHEAAQFRAVLLEYRGTKQNAPTIFWPGRLLRILA
jgi:hypothetical protein